MSQNNVQPPDAEPQAGLWLSRAFAIDGLLIEVWQLPVGQDDATPASMVCYCGLLLDTSRWPHRDSVSVADRVRALVADTLDYARGLVRRGRLATWDLGEPMTVAPLLHQLALVNTEDPVVATWLPGNFVVGRPLDAGAQRYRLWMREGTSHPATWHLERVAPQNGEQRIGPSMLFEEGKRAPQAEVARTKRLPAGSVTLGIETTDGVVAGPTGTLRLVPEAEPEEDVAVDEQPTIDLTALPPELAALDQQALLRLVKLRKQHQEGEQ